MFGFSTDPNLNAHYNSIDFSWYVDNGGMHVYEFGNQVGSATYDEESVYTIARVGSTVSYYQDGVLKRSVSGITTADLYLDSSFHSSIELRDIKVGVTYVEHAGRILQVVSGVATAGITSYSNSWTNMISVNITPTRADSKIAIFVNIGSMYMNLNSAVAQFYWKIARNGSNITGHNTNFHAEIGRGETNIGQRGFLSMSGVDSPNLSTSITYSAQAARQNGSGGVLINDTSGTSSIIVMEIGA
jgi:hypothetical protein